MAKNLILLVSCCHIILLQRTLCCKQIVRKIISTLICKIHTHLGEILHYINVLSTEYIIEIRSGNRYSDNIYLLDIVIVSP